MGRATLFMLHCDDEVSRLQRGSLASLGRAEDKRASDGREAMFRCLW
jgi:hypothetical protein